MEKAHSIVDERGGPASRGIVQHLRNSCYANSIGQLLVRVVDLGELVASEREEGGIPPNPVKTAVKNVIDMYGRVDTDPHSLGRLVGQLQLSLGHPYTSGAQCDAGEFLADVLQNLYAQDSATHAWRGIKVVNCACHAPTEAKDGGHILTLSAGNRDVQRALDEHQVQEIVGDCICEDCGSAKSTTFRFEGLPEVFFLQFKYTTAELKDFDTRMAASAEVMIGGHIYRLVSAVLRTGSEANQGHYSVCFPNEEGYIRISDSNVSQIERERLQKGGRLTIAAYVRKAKAMELDFDKITERNVRGRIASELFTEREKKRMRAHANDIKAAHAEKHKPPTRKRTAKADTKKKIKTAARSLEHTPELTLETQAIESRVDTDLQVKDGVRDVNLEVDLAFLGEHGGAKNLKAVALADYYQSLTGEDTQEIILHALLALLPKLGAAAVTRFTKDVEHSLRASYRHILLGEASKFRATFNGSRANILQLQAFMALLDDEAVQRAYSPPQARAAFQLIGGVKVNQLASLEVTSVAKEYFIAKYGDCYLSERHLGRPCANVLTCFLVYQAADEAAYLFNLLNAQERAELAVAIRIHWSNITEGEAVALINVPQLLDRNFLDLLNAEEAEQRGMLLPLITRHGVGREAPASKSYRDLASTYAANPEAFGWMCEQNVQNASLALVRGVVSMAFTLSKDERCEAVKDGLSNMLRLGRGLKDTRLDSQDEVSQLIERREAKVGELDPEMQQAAGRMDRIIREVCAALRYQYLAHQSWWLHLITQNHAEVLTVQADTGSGKTLLMLALARHKGETGTLIVTHNALGRRQILALSAQFNQFPRVACVTEVTAAMLDGVHMLIIDEIQDQLSSSLLRADTLTGECTGLLPILKGFNGSGGVYAFTAGLDGVASLYLRNVAKKMLGADVQVLNLGNIRSFLTGQNEPSALVDYHVAPDEQGFHEKYTELAEQQDGPVMIFDCMDSAWKTPEAKARNHMRSKGARPYGREQHLNGDTAAPDKPLLVSKDLGVGVTIKFPKEAVVIVLISGGSRLSPSLILQYIGRGNRRVGTPRGHVLFIGADFADAQALELASQQWGLAEEGDSYLSWLLDVYPALHDVGLTECLKTRELFQEKQAWKTRQGQLRCAKAMQACATIKDRQARRQRKPNGH